MGRGDLNKPVKELYHVVDSVVYSDQSIEAALEELRKKQMEQKIIYFYVVDRENKLLGVIPTRKLLLENPKHIIRDIMEFSVVRLTENQTTQEAMELFAKHKLLSLPVVSISGVLLGVIDVNFYFEESVDVASLQHKQDIFQFIGLSLEEGKRRSLWKNYSLRMPWIFCNIFGGLVCALISHFNAMVLTNTVLIAIFIPLVLTLSESVAMQAMTQTLHFVKMSVRYGRKRAWREWKTVAFMALSAAIIVGVISLLWEGGKLPSFTIALGILLSITISASFAIILPLILHRNNLDPKVASGPVVLMLTDILTTTIYLSLATGLLL